MELQGQPHPSPNAHRGASAVREARWDWRTKNGFKSFKDWVHLSYQDTLEMSASPWKKPGCSLSQILPPNTGTLRLKHKARRVRQESKPWGGVSLQNTSFPLPAHPATWPTPILTCEIKKAPLGHQPAQSEDFWWFPKYAGRSLISLQ